MEAIPTPGLGRAAREPGGRWVAGTPGQAPLDEARVPVGTKLLGTQALRRARGDLGQASDSGHVGLLSFRRQPRPLPLADHLGTERGPRSSCACQGEQTLTPPAGAMTELLYGMGGYGQIGVWTPGRFSNPARARGVAQEMKGQRRPARKLPRRGLVQQPFHRNFILDKSLLCCHCCQAPLLIFSFPRFFS
jgi:hypothetical protein